MPQSLCQMYTHIVFSTKNRIAHLSDRDCAAKVHAYLAGICRNLDSPSIIVGGPDDHVHILCFLSSGISIRDLLRELKRDSSEWIKRTYPQMKKFFWQSGYGAFSVSPSHVNDLKKIHHEPGGTSS